MDDYWQCALLPTAIRSLLLLLNFNLFSYPCSFQLDKVWSKDMESFENEWGHVMEEFDWMGPTKNEDDYQNLEENEVSVHLRLLSIDLTNFICKY